MPVTFQKRYVQIERMRGIALSCLQKCFVNEKASGVKQQRTCSLSLWRVVRGSKLMHLDLMHGLLIT
jgi:hypothetical protein